MFGINELLEIVEFQKWPYLFVPPAPSVYEAEVVEFYTNLCYTDDCTLALSVNETDFELDELKLGEILEVPTDGMKTVSDEASDAFKNVIVKREGSSTRARLLKKKLKPEYHLLFALVNEVVLPRAEGRFIASIADLVLLEAINSTISTLIKAQEMSTDEIQRLKIENALLRVQLAKNAYELGSHGDLEAANAENEKLWTKNEKLR
ncbi:hypothetical protein RND71_007609 [Anisodus tanguticus]|uniref:Uncharacterized protein n=1 Tax=Anisodus tanguticus TaxID=243964 RepID=A0AAE1SLP2_9SOLA|nr:hypothetical protein RND71_007609 [Anisodus tanguticus]